MNPDIPTVCRLLEQDTLANLVTLKMVNRFPSSMNFELLEGADGWALLSLLDVRDSEWDRKTYPGCKFVAFINGNSAAGKVQLLASLPKHNLVIKTSDQVVEQAIAETRNATRVRTFHSFTTGKQFSPQSAPGVRQSNAYNERAWTMFRANGYEDQELAQYFQNGAQWFATESQGQLASACLVFPNYKEIWELGGVFTRPEFRRKGFAQIAVLAGLNYLLASGLIPRYQTTGDNHASLCLARSCGLTEFLQMTHYLLAANE